MFEYLSICVCVCVPSLRICFLTHTNDVIKYRLLKPIGRVKCGVLIV